MRLPRGMTKKRRRFFGRLHRNGVEVSIPLGPDLGQAIAAFYRAKAGVQPARDRGVTVREAAARFIDEYVATARNEKGRRDVRFRIENGIIGFMGDKAARDVNRADLRALRRWLETERRDLTATTIGHYLADARCMLRWCEDAELLDRAPVPARLLPRIQERPPDRLTDEDASLLASLPDPHGFVLRFALATGLRWGELTRAKRTDVTPDGWLEVSQTKSGRMRRVPLDRDILAEIVARKGRLVPYAERSPGSFTAAVRRHARKWLKALPNEERERHAGLETFHMHQTRHTFACRWIEGGGSLDSLQRILGHQDQKTTQRYGQPSDRYVREEAHRVHRTLTGGEVGHLGLVGQVGRLGHLGHLRDREPGTKPGTRPPIEDERN